MTDLSEIQDKIYAKMDNKLKSVTYPFTGERKEPIEPFDPDNPDQFNTVTYEGKGIFGLAFNKDDSLIYQIEQNDQKAIAFMKYTTNVPEVEDNIVYDGVSYKIIKLNVIPASNGWVMQLRRV